MDPLARCGRAFLNSVPSDVQSLDEMFVAVNFHCKRVTMRQSESLPIFVVFFLCMRKGVACATEFTSTLELLG